MTGPLLGWMQSSHWFFSCSQKAQRPVQLHKPKGMLQYLANTLFDQLHSVQPEDWLLCPLSEPQDSQGCFGTYTAAHRNTLSGGRSGLSNNQALSSVPILRFFLCSLALPHPSALRQCHHKPPTSINWTQYSQQICCILSIQTQGNLRAEQKWNMGSVSQQIVFATPA